MIQEARGPAVKTIMWIVVTIYLAQSFVPFSLADSQHRPQSENAYDDHHLGNGSLSFNDPRYAHSPVEVRFDNVSTQNLKTRDFEGLSYEDVSYQTNFDGSFCTD